MEEISRAVEDALAYRIAKTVRIRDKWLYGYSIAATTLVLFYIVFLKLGVDKVQHSSSPSHTHTLSLSHTHTHTLSLSL